MRTWTRAVAPNQTATNQAQVVRALEEAGATVLVIELSAGMCGLLVGFRETNYLLRCKLPKALKTVYECRFEDEWRGSVYVVRSADEALDVIGANR